VPRAGKAAIIFALMGSNSTLVIIKYLASEDVRCFTSFFAVNNEKL
jgi:flagellar motor switch protein FliG